MTNSVCASRSWTTADARSGHLCWRAHGTCAAPRWPIRHSLRRADIWLTSNSVPQLPLAVTVCVSNSRTSSTPGSVSSPTSLTLIQSASNESTLYRTLFARLPHDRLGGKWGHNISAFYAMHPTMHLGVQTEAVLLISVLSASLATACYATSPSGSIPFSFTLPTLCSLCVCRAPS